MFLIEGISQTDPCIGGEQELRLFNSSEDDLECLVPVFLDDLHNIEQNMYSHAE